MKSFCLICFAAIMLIAAPAMAADAAAGKAKSATCTACHGAEGVSVNPMWPNLAGQKDMYMVKQMKARKSTFSEETVRVLSHAHRCCRFWTGSCRCAWR